MQNIIAIIPARSGSKSIPKKNICLLGEHPLIAYSIGTARLSDYIERVIVSTDSHEIAEISKAYGAEVPFLRPEKISQDNSTDLEFFEHFIRFCGNNQNPLPEYMVHLRPTTPLREVSFVDCAIEETLNQKDATSLRSAHCFDVSPYKIFKMKGPYFKGFFSEDPRSEYYNLPRQNFPQTYKPNGYVDIVRTSTIRRGMLHGDKMLGFITPKVPDIDCPEDLEYAKAEIDDIRFKPLIQFLNTCHQ